MRIAMSPTQQANYRCYITKSLNFKQAMCKGPCKMRRSLGQFNNHPEYCDRCYNRMPKAA